MTGNLQIIEPFPEANDTAVFGAIQAQFKF